MKTFFILLCVSGLTVSYVHNKDVIGKYPRLIKFPGGDGKLHNVDLKAEIDINFLENINRNPANNAYHLYTRRNPKTFQILSHNDAESITSSFFNPSVTTVVIAHGWLSNFKASLNPVIRDAYLEKSDVNVIVMDWGKLAKSTYSTAVAGVPFVGRGLGQFLNFLNRVTGAPFDKMHLIGFSLGAHLVGNAGRELGGRVARVTGLDPAGPLWQFNNNRLSETDAIYVEAIHTDGSLIGLGIGSAVAKVDFFPNGGNSQPGCLTSVCNHDRSWEFFAATVTFNHLVGRECENNLQIAANTCRGNYLHMGNNILNKTGRSPKTSQILSHNDADSITSSFFNPSLPTVVIAHGWLSNSNARLNPVIRDAYLEKSDVNVIVMDWGRLAISTYGIAIAGVPAVSRGLGQFLNFLNRVTGAPFDRMHLIGFSLGAHLVGNAGRELGGKIASVTGLDPAGPLWQFNNNRLSETDAIYVEAIHTDGSVIGLGIGSAVAKVDFFPNGGNSQPGCLTNVCNHDRSWELFAATVTYNHLVGRECKNNFQIIADTCRGNYLHMGNDILNKTGSGSYRVNTGRRFPF